MAVIHSDAPPVHRPSRRNLGFGIGSALLLLCALWMVWFDYNRDWKNYQREFRDLEIARATAKLDQESARLGASQDLAAVEQQLAAAEEELAARVSDLEAADAALREAQNAFYVAEEHWKVEKSYYDAGKYEFEEERKHILESSHAPDAGGGGHGADAAPADEATQAAVAHAQERLDRLEKNYLDAARGLEDAKTALAQAEAQRASLTGKVDAATKQLNRLTETETILMNKIEALEPTLTKTIRDAPVIDMASPTLKVDQVILPHLLTDINFLKIPKVDRCVTCHKGIMDANYEGEAQPFMAHPRLDLYLSDSSPHPYNQFGCTVCHQGLDRATSFASAMHTPRDAEQEADWEERYGWHSVHFWDFPQLPAQHAQASCRTCHLNEVRLKGADRYNRGLDLVESAGCFGCHKIGGYEDRRKTGPDLKHVASKVSEDWAYRWIEDPRAYRPTTWMPKFFNLSNTNSPQDQARAAVEIDAMVSYLFARSEPFEPTVAAVPAGDAERGRRTGSERGCLGCHRIGEAPTVRGAYGRDFGPALDRVADKLSPRWLYDWVRDPKRYFEHTNMPDLRLTDQEAADIVAFLMTLKGSAPQPRPATDAALLDAVSLEYLQARLTHAQASERLGAMGEKEKKVFLGEKLIGRYGCYGCHNIAGFEQALPIGTELTTEGSKMITRLEFGFVHIPHTKIAWFHQKLKDPRIFDTGKVKLPQEKLKMPDFGFTDEEADTLVTLIMSMQKDVLPLDSHRMLDERTAAVEKGRRIIQDRNCRGCHPIEGSGGAIQETIADQGYWPPNLFREGEKVQSNWLFGFLREPSSIRPWLNARMPTFHFDNDDATTLVKYFSAADSAPYPFQPAREHPATRELLAEGEKTFDQFKCMSCHPVGPPPAGVAAGDLAPDLTKARERLRHDWVAKWLRDPQAFTPGTRMPGFFYSGETPLYPDAEQRMNAVAEYVLTLAQSDRLPRRASR